jgi:cytidylate kinase
MAIITISRGTMSGGKQLAEMLADRLKYRCASREIIVEAANKYGVPENKLLDAIRKSPSIFQKLTFEREQYLAYIQAILCEYAKDDNLIYHGNAGHFLLPGVSHVLRIRLVAEMPYRIKAAMAQFSLSEKEAINYIKQVDRERVKWTKFLYGKDWRSPELYDLVFNLGRTDLDFICELIVHAVKQPEFQATPQSTIAMNNLLLASKVRGALASIHSVRLDLLEIHAENGTVTISGKVKSPKLLDEILEMADGIPGVDNINNKVRVDYRGYGIE